MMFVVIDVRLVSLSFLVLSLVEAVLGTGNRYLNVEIKGHQRIVN